MRDVAYATMPIERREGTGKGQKRMKKEAKRKQHELRGRVKKYLKNIFNNGFYRLHGFSSLLNVSKLLICVIGEIRCSFNLTRFFNIWLLSLGNNWCQYSNILPPRNSRSRLVGGIWLSWIGLMYRRKWSRRCASVYSSQFSGTCSNRGTA